MRTNYARFTVGQLINHKLLKYRGVIVDVDPDFQHADEWYELMAKSRPAKNQPWYHVLVDDTDYMTYVAEQNLEMDCSREPITHPDLKQYFDEIHNGLYITKRRTN